MANLVMRGFRHSNDYEKAKLTQEQLLKVAIANDANTSAARKALKRGEVPLPSELESADIAELERDKSKMYDEGLSNIKSLGFRGDVASGILGDILDDGDDKLYKMNQTFPAIYKDLTTRFNIKSMTPQFFKSYLDQYISNLDASKGLTSNPYGSSYSQLIDTASDLRAILPSKNDVRDILDALIQGETFTARQQSLLEPIMERLNDLEGSLPSEDDLVMFDGLSNEDSATAFEIAQSIQETTQDLPTRDDWVELLGQIEEGSLSNADIIRKLNSFVSSVSEKNTSALKSLVDILKTPSTSPFDKEVNSPLGRLGLIGNRVYLYRDGRKDEINATSLRNDIRPRFAGNKDALNFIAKGVRAILAYVMSEEGIDTSSSSSSSSSSGSQSASAVSQKEGGIRMTVEEKPPLSQVEGEEEVGSGLRRGKKPLKVIKMGKGIAVEQQPKYKELGKYAIHWGQLVNNDILNVKYKSLGGIPQFKPIAISDVFKDFLIDLMENGKANARTYDQVPTDERKLFERIATGAGIIHTLKLKKTITNQDAEDNKRFELLKGEYLAGNNSNAVMKELRRYVIKFMNEGKITKNTGLNFLMELAV
jgi:hypothetical protein